MGVKSKLEIWERMENRLQTSFCQEPFSQKLIPQLVPLSVEEPAGMFSTSLCQHWVLNIGDLKVHMVIPRQLAPLSKVLTRENPIVKTTCISPIHSLRRRELNHLHSSPSHCNFVVVPELRQKRYKEQSYHKIRIITLKCLCWQLWCT
jgi:hypothetical protein